MNISLTTFLDFINSRGTDKPGIVKDTIKQGEYNPNNDLYKDIREMIVSIQKGHKTIDDLLSISKRSKQKRVYMLDKNTLEVIKIFDSIMDASRELKINNSNISMVCKGKRKWAGGYGWKYVDE